MSKLPECGQDVEVLLNGEWRRATFRCADYCYDDDDGEETWWLHHFSFAESFETYPDDTHTDMKEIPEWRPYVQI
jgi:hypothetical protein